MFSFINIFVFFFFLLGIKALTILAKFQCYFIFTIFITLSSNHSADKTFYADICVLDINLEHLNE